jgi:hypothetical protein
MLKNHVKLKTYSLFALISIMQTDYIGKGLQAFTIFLDTDVFNSIHCIVTKS